MLQLVTTSQFRKDLKRIRKRNLDLKKLQVILDKLIHEEPLDASYCDHALVGNYIGFRECHIEPDWLLVYSINKNQLILTAARTESHSDLF